MSRRPSSPTLDSVATINRDGSRRFLHPADVTGRWTSARRIFGLVLMALYAALPWIPVNGYPALFFDVLHGHFHFFGLTLVTQDLWLLVFAISGLGFTLFVVTAVLGRLWCGWACPYTVFLDQIFRRIERLLEGDAVQRRRLDAMPWGPAKILRRGAKHILYLLAATTIAHIFLSYFFSIPGLYARIGEGPAVHFAVFASVASLTLILWFCFAWFREQFCIILCPYGRLQSALTDDDTVIIGYDGARGEPRGAKSGPAAGGDCIDCFRCVNVCPTGIDIRNGLQLECIGCAACIDACDTVMRKTGRPTGLVRYDSLKGLAGAQRRWLRPRIVLYAVLGMLGLTAFAAATWTRARPFTSDCSRMRGQPFFADGSAVRNHFQLHFLNKRNQTARYSLRLAEAPAGFILSGADGITEVPALGESTRPVIVLAPLSAYRGGTDIVLEAIAQPGGVVMRHRVHFLGPELSPSR